MLFCVVRACNPLGQDEKMKKRNEWKIKNNILGGGNLLQLPIFFQEKEYISGEDFLIHAYNAMKTIFFNLWVERNFNFLFIFINFLFRLFFCNSFGE